MTKIKNNSPLVNITSTDQVKFVGDIPTCALTGDCLIDETNLTYLISILLTRYCVDNNVVDADLSSVDFTCLLISNPDIELPENITVENLATYYKNHFCSLYSTISDLQDIIDSIKGITCLNDIVQLDQNSSILIDPLFNDSLDEVTGTAIVTIISASINGNTSITANQITYTPDTDFFGNDQITYQVTKGDYTCTAKISIKVNEIISSQTITELVTEQVTIILQSDEYWDIGLDVGTKLSVTESKLAYFNLIGGSWGAGLPGTRYSKWAICNGNNGTDDERGLTTRGFDVNNVDYNDTSSFNSNGSDSITLNVNNIPPHRHTFSFLHRDVNNNYQEWAVEHTSSTGGFTTENGDLSIPIREELDTDAGDANNNNTQYWIGGGNTGNGAENINNQEELSNIQNSINIRNAYFTEIKIQKIL